MDDRGVIRRLTIRGEGTSCGEKWDGAKWDSSARIARDLGLIATGLFYGAIRAGLIDHPLALRYLAGHPIEYAEVAMFFVGLCAITMRGATVLAQWSAISQIELPEVPLGGMATEEAGALADSLQQLPRSTRATYLVRRWSDLLAYVARKDSADQLDAELIHLSDLDAARMQEGYGLSRIIIWATPMLGSWVR